MISVSQNSLQENNGQGKKSNSNLALPNMPGQGLDDTRYNDDYEQDMKKQDEKNYEYDSFRNDDSMHDVVKENRYKENTQNNIDNYNDPSRNSDSVQVISNQNSYPGGYVDNNNNPSYNSNYNNIPSIQGGVVAGAGSENYNTQPQPSYQGYPPGTYVLTPFEAADAYGRAKFIVEQSECFRSGLDFREVTYFLDLTGSKTVGSIYPLNPEHTVYGATIYGYLTGNNRYPVIEFEVPVEVDISKGQVTKCDAPGVNIQQVISEYQSKFGYIPENVNPLSHHYSYYNDHRRYR